MIFVRLVEYRNGLKEALFLIHARWEIIRIEIKALASSVWNISKLAVGRLSPKYLDGIIESGLALPAIFSHREGGRPYLAG